LAVDAKDCRGVAAVVFVGLGVVVFARFRVMPEGQAEARLPVIHSPALWGHGDLRP
jgi:hypothetical protein